MATVKTAISTEILGLLVVECKSFFLNFVGYFMMLATPKLNIFEYYRIGKNLEGSGIGSVEALFVHLPG
jgi:hypothetical protein